MSIFRKKCSYWLFFVFLFLFIITGCASKFETVSEHDKRLKSESENRQKILEQLNTSKPEESTPSNSGNRVSEKKESQSDVIKENEKGSSSTRTPNSVVARNKKTSSKTNKNKKNEKEKTDTKTPKPQPEKSDISVPETTKEPEKSEYIIVYVTISCTNVLSHADYKQDGSLPSNGFILSNEKIPIIKGESVFTAIQVACKDRNIELSYMGSPKGNNLYVQSVYNLKEKQYGKYSGWMYKVGSTSPGVGMAAYIPKEGEHIELYYITS